jgi:hypothetical protein
MIAQPCQRRDLAERIRMRQEQAILRHLPKYAYLVVEYLGCDLHHHRVFSTDDARLFVYRRIQPDNTQTIEVEIEVKDMLHTVLTVELTPYVENPPMLFVFAHERLSFTYDSIKGYVPGEWERVLAEHAYIARTKRDAQQRLLARAEAEEALSRWGLEVQEAAA